ncbi:MAG: hypothetical protein RIQ60_3643 [Pseudomonadota bacterium]|jgi:signal transduction histidine kinase/ActR/RegA family two-component response regulator
MKKILSRWLRWVRWRAQTPAPDDGSMQNAWLRASLLWLLLFGVGIALVLFDAVGNIRATEEAQRKDLAVTAQLLGEHVERSLTALDAALQETAEAVRRDGLPAVSGDAGHEFLRQKVRHFAGDAQLFIYGLDGNTLSTSAARQPPKFNAAERNYFKQLLAGAPEPYVDRALYGKTVHKFFFPLARRLVSRDGAVIGVVQIGVDMNYLAHVFRFTGQHGIHSALLRSEDGMLVTADEAKPEWMGVAFVPPAMLGGGGPADAPRLLRLPVLGQERQLALLPLPGRNLTLMRWDERAPEPMGWNRSSRGPWLLSIFMVLSLAIGLWTWRRDFKLRLALYRRQLELVQASDAALARAEAQARLLQQILAAAPMAVCITRQADGEVAFLNQEYGRMTQRSEAAAKELPARQLFCNVEIFDAIQRRLDQGETVVNELVELQLPARPDAAHVWALLSCMAVDYAQQPSVLAWYCDVTAIQNAKSSSEQANAAKSAFLATISHEIRTPLNSIVGLSHLLAQSHLSDEQLRDVQAVTVASQNLLGLVNDVLDFSKIEANELELDYSPFSLTEMLSEQQASFTAQAALKGIDFQLTVGGPALPEVLVGDPIRLRQILVNLLNNAVKFTNKGSVALSVAWRSGPSDRQVVLQMVVTDTGVGISEEFLQRLFQPFRQADTSTSRVFGGTGLGLSIVKRLLELMRGKIEVHSQLGQGTRFELEIPFIRGQADELVARSSPRRSPDAATQTPQANHVAAAPLDGRSILVVDDSAMNLEVIRRILLRVGAQVSVCTSGQDALELLAAAPAVDLVLMDMQMPGMDGVQTMAHLRSLAACAHIPVIALTAGATVAERERALASGMIDFLTKPVDPPRLIQVLQQHAGAAARLDSTIARRT